MAKAFVFACGELAPSAVERRALLVYEYSSLKLLTF